MIEESHKDTEQLEKDESIQVQSRVAYLEDKLEKLLLEEAKRSRAELEAVMEESEGIIIADHPQEKQKINNNTLLNRKYLSKIINECPEGVFEVDKKGNIITFHMKASVLRDNDDQLTGAIILLKDVSERKKVEDELKEKKDRLRCV